MLVLREMANFVMSVASKFSAKYLDSASVLSMKNSSLSSVSSSLIAPTPLSNQPQRWILFHYYGKAITSPDGSLTIRGVHILRAFLTALPFLNLMLIVSLCLRSVKYQEDGLFE